MNSQVSQIFRKAAFVGLIGLACSCAWSQQNASSADVKTVISTMPTSSSREMNDACAKLVKMGPDAVSQLAAMLVPPGKGDDVKARFALNSMAFYAGRAGAAADRKMYANALAAELDKQQDPEVKDFLIEQLQFVVIPDNVAVLAKYINDQRLGNPAIRGLLTVGNADAAEALAAAVADAPQERKPALIIALGQIRAKNAKDKLVGFAQDANEDVRLLALQALSNMGAEEAIALLEKELDATQSVLRRGKLTSYQMMLAERLAEAGAKEKAIELCHAVMEKRTAPADEYAQCGALATLAKIQGAAAMPDLLKAMDSEVSSIRAAAIRQAVKIKGAPVTSQLSKKATAAEPVLKAELLRELGLRGDRAALEVARKSMNDTDPGVQEAAVWAAYRLSGRKIVSDLLAVLRESNKDLQLTATKQLLITAADDRGLAAIAKALPQIQPAARIALIEVLSERNAAGQKKAIADRIADPERRVRLAALKAMDTLATDEDVEPLTKLLTTAESAAERSGAQRAIVAAVKRSQTSDTLVQGLVKTYETGSPELKPMILETLGRTGSKAAFDPILTETKNPNADLKTAAIRALGEWPDATPMEELMRIAREDQETNFKVLAIRGYVRMTGEESVPVDRKIAILKEAMSLAPRADEKQLVLGRLGDIKTTEAIATVYPYLMDKDLKGDAAISIVKITKPERRQAIIGGGVAAAALRLAYPLIKEEEMKKQAKAQLDQAEFQLETTPQAADSEGFVSLFNGQDLNGWVGALSGYTVENGAIVCQPKGGGNLFTERQYTDFEFRCEFKLESGANNGIGIRAPLEGDAAFAGMEVQVLDDTSDKYKDLKEWQHHGSIYGVAPSQTGHLKPVGEWNSQVITAKGKHITVELNGTKIVDAELDRVSPEDKTLDGRPHPGIKRVGGHIGFLGHGSRVEFRNIKIKELLNDPPEGFTALFNGKDLEGWKGLVENPIKRAQMRKNELARKQEKADEEMRKNWQVANQTIIFDGKGSHLCTTKDYGDFEMTVDWRMGPLGDSGIYLRGSPQVQIWDPAQWPVGSGGLYNNNKNSSSPLAVADNPIGDWNNFRIKMVGDKVTVHFNDVLVVDNVTLENYWDRSQPIFPTGQIELQSHGSPMYFRNIYLREVKPGEDQPKKEEPTAPAEQTTSTENEKAAEPAEPKKEETTAPASQPAEQAATSGTAVQQ